MSQIMAKAYDDVCERGEVGLLLLPASESLYHFYSEMGFKTSFFFDEIEFSSDEPVDSRKMPPFKIEKIDAERYFQLRKDYLTADFSVLNPLDYFLLTEGNPDENNYGFYMIFGQNGQKAICYVSKNNNILMIKELLSLDMELTQLQTFLSHSFDVKRLFINIPGTKKKSAQIKLNTAYSFLEKKKGYFNFGLE